MRPRAVLWLIVLMILALALRLCALKWNFFPHADVAGDAVAGDSFLQFGRFLSESKPDASPMIGHSPLWSFLGALLARLLGGSGVAGVFLSLRILSVLSGMGILLLLFVVVRRLVNEQMALWSILWGALSFLLIDYAGNGAFYSLQALLYLLWLLLALRQPGIRRSLFLGAMTGAAYTVNFQSSVLLLAALALELLQQRRRFLFRAAILIATAGFVAAPIFLRSFLLTGDSFAHHLANMTYVYAKAGIQPLTMIDGVPRYAPGIGRYAALLDVLFTYWLPNNAFYIARKLFVLAPVAFVFLCYGLIDQLLDAKRRRRLLPVFLLAGFHVLIAASWPVTKFRYFVPLLPLVFLLSMDAVQGFLKPGRVRTLTLSLITASIALGSVLTYFSVPTHTYYYDGAITTDPFSGRGEWNYLRDQGLLPPAK